MINKKRLAVISGVCILVLGGLIGGIAVGANILPQEEIEIMLSDRSQVTDADRDDLYIDFIKKSMISEFKENGDILDCELDVNYSSKEIISVNVSIVTNKDEIDALETSIQNYISQSWGISTENISISFN